MYIVDQNSSFEQNKNIIQGLRRLCTLDCICHKNIYTHTDPLTWHYLALPIKSKPYCQKIYKFYQSSHNYSL